MSPRFSKRTGSGWPACFAEAAAGIKQALGDAGRLTDFGAKLIRLPPGAWSSPRHWHVDEDEFVCVVSGELNLVTDAGEQVLSAHDCAAFPRNQPDGHHLINRGIQVAFYLKIGSRREHDVCHYPDIDPHWDPAVGVYPLKEGTAYS